jgi:hypothetical protein
MIAGQPARKAPIRMSDPAALPTAGKILGRICEETAGSIAAVTSAGAGAISRTGGARKRAGERAGRRAAISGVAATSGVAPASARPNARHCVRH